jgi:hypothetical protein
MAFKPKPKPTKAQMHALFGTSDFKSFDDTPNYDPPKPKQPRKRNPFRQYEDQLQKQIVKWFALQYPDLTDLLCYNLNNSRNMYAAVKDKALGLTKGRNDLSLYYRGKALMLELKAQDGKQSEAQREFQSIATKYGNHYRVTNSFDEATDIIRKFITWCDQLGAKENQ